MNMRLNSTWILSALLGFSTACGSTSNSGGAGGSTGGSPAASTGGASPSAGTSTSAGTMSTAGTKSDGGSTNAGGMTSNAGMSAGGGGGAGPGAAFACPADRPEEGAMCTRMIPTACPYDDGGCVCKSGAWDCYAKSDCPATAPADAATCDLGGMQCSYDESLACTCSTMNGWSCSKPCPMAEPADDASCRRPAGSTCRYATGTLVSGFMTMADTTCACNDDKFSCFGQSDCPADAPKSGDTCEFSTLSCSFTGNQCTCGQNGSWTCTTDCPMATPADDDACDRPQQQSCRYNAGALISGGGFGMGAMAEATCTCRDMKFACISQDDCPAAAPENTSDCADLTGLACSYTDQQCTCGQMGWNCQTSCPAALPADAASCSRPITAPCRYAAGALLTSNTATAEDTCVCQDNAFNCFSAADCPSAMPANSAVCGQPGLNCPFDDQTCHCSTSNGTWSCNMTMTMGGRGGGGAGGTSAAGASPMATAGGGAGGNP
jgi:hypothetical protein